MTGVSLFSVSDQANSMLAREFQLVAACCIWPPSERRNQAIRDAAAKPVSWPKVVELAHRHRIIGLVCDGLRSAGIAVPIPQMDSLAGAAREAAHHNLRLATESLQLQGMFDKAGLPTLFLKGAALSQLAYGSLSLKQARDIDVLVAPADLHQACKLLGAAGYTRTVPPAGLDDHRFEYWMGFAHECEFFSPAQGTHVELHTRLASNARLLARISVHAAAQEVPIAVGRALRTLGDEDLFAYLCLHGARHGWSRIKWLADIGAWLASKPPAEIDRLYQCARAKGVERAATGALLLSARLFGTRLPASLPVEASQNRPIRWLEAVAVRAITADDVMLDRVWGYPETELSHFILGAGWMHWLDEIRAKSVSLSDVMTISLPSRLFFLYPALRIPLGLFRQMRRLASRAFNAA